MAGIRASARGGAGAGARTRPALSARQILDAATSERALQEALTAYATRRGWYWWHDEDPRRNREGFPDLLLVRERVVWVELKAEYGRLRPAQRAFLARLTAAGAETYVWRPSDWSSGRVEAVLA